MKDRPRWTRMGRDMSVGPGQTKRVGVGQPLKQCCRKTVPSIVEGFGNDVSNVLSPKSKNIIACYQKWSWAAGPASKGQVQCFLIKNEAGPRFQLQNDCPAPFLRQDGGRQVGRASPAGRGVPGLPGKRARSGTEPKKRLPRGGV